MNPYTGKNRVSDKVLDQAVHELAMIAVNMSMKESHLEPVDAPNILADLYCNASEMIRKRINEQRLTDGTNPDRLSSCDRSKVWFSGDVTEVVFYGSEKIRRP